MNRLVFIYPRTKLYFTVIEIPFVIKCIAVLTRKSLKTRMSFLPNFFYSTRSRCLTDKFCDRKRIWSEDQADGRPNGTKSSIDNVCLFAACAVELYCRQ